MEASAVFAGIDNVRRRLNRGVAPDISRAQALQWCVRAHNSVMVVDETTVDASNL